MGILGMEDGQDDDNVYLKVYESTTRLQKQRMLWRHNYASCL